MHAFEDAQCRIYIAQTSARTHASRHTHTHTTYTESNRNVPSGPVNLLFSSSIKWIPWNSTLNYNIKLHMTNTNEQDRRRWRKKNTTWIKWRWTGIHHMCQAIVTLCRLVQLTLLPLHTHTRTKFDRKIEKRFMNWILLLVDIYPKKQQQQTEKNVGWYFCADNKY